MSRLVRSWLYVPGHRSELVEKAWASGADAVVLDLQDSVPSGHKGEARRRLRDVNPAPDGRQLWVRVNDAGSPWLHDDLAEAAGLAALDGVRLPRAEDPEVVHDVAEAWGRPLQLLLETARGLLRAQELAAAHPLVEWLSLGETDLAADLRVDPAEGLAWSRGWVVAAARAAGLNSPIQSVWTDVRDLDGLRRSTERAKRLGFAGRSVVHPSQVEVVNDVFTPTPEEVERARAVLRSADGSGDAHLDTTGRLVDPAVAALATNVLRNADLATESPLTK